MDLRVSRSQEISFLFGILFVAALVGYAITGQVAVAVSLVVGLTPVILSAVSHH